jgi:tetratricopeptide (TPR) repeat protein
MLRTETVGRNDRCPCGSGRKYKLCCGRQPHAARPAGSAAVTGARQRAHVLLQQAAGLETAGRLHDAVAALRLAAQATPDDPVAHYNLGLMCLKANLLPEATASLRQALDLDPGFDRAHYTLGVALQNQGHLAEAETALRAAAERGSRRTQAYARLGDVLEARGQFADAATCYRRAADDTIAGRLNLAKALVAENDREAAVELLRRVIARAPDHADASWTLGTVLLALGRFREALLQLDRAMALAPEAVGPFSSRVLAARVTEADRPMVSRMAARFESGSLHDTGRIKLGYALGKAFDDLGEYSTAIHWFDTANRIEKGLTTFDRTDVATWVDLLITRCTQDYFARHADLGSADETPVLIVGMPRSGTTLVEQIISSHPAVAAGDELDFWLRRGPPWEHRDGEGLTPGPITRLADNYLAVLRGIAPEAQRVTDKLPLNLMWLGLIHLVFPRARIIHCRRHPVDTCLSIYFTQFLHRPAFASDRGDLVFQYREYERLMQHWRAVLPAERFLEVDYSDVVADPEASARRLIAFCGLPWDDACRRPENNQRVVKTASMWQARQPVYRTSVERWRRYEPWLGELRELLDPAG